MVYFFMYGEIEALLIFNYIMYLIGLFSGALCTDLGKLFRFCLNIVTRLCTIENNSHDQLDFSTLLKWTSKFLWYSQEY